MKQRLTVLVLLISGWAMAQSYPPSAGQEGSTAIAHHSDLFVAWANGVEIERGFINISNPTAHDQGSNYASYGQPEDALGMPDNNVVSLGDGGVAVLTFETPIGNGPGFDFAVFENGWEDDFLELAFVEVSSDGENFFRFPAHSETQTDSQIATFGALDPTYLNNLAGKYRVFFGTPFDLDEIENHPLLDKNKITHVKLIDVVGSINPEFATYDAYGNIVNDPFPTPFWSSGFDLDGVGVINQQVLETHEFFSESFQIYPNPAKEAFYIGIHEPVKIQIYDANGKMVLRTNSINNQEIPISNLEKGIYFVHIESEQSTSLHKLIKK